MVLSLMMALLCWLWPIGLGGQMIVGGDVTQFSLGPMSVLSHALKSWRLPIWNELWGYGFPGVGESQIGVYYPVHWLLYGCLPLETAYTYSLVIHTLWGGLGAWFAARRFGISAVGAFLSGYSWATCGFFVIHLPHQWGYTTGSWMPWIWGLGWSQMQGGGGRRETFLLALALTLQLLPGHFQLAFYTQVGLLLLAGEVVVDRLNRGEKVIKEFFCISFALVGAFCLAAAQIWPTLRLARLAAQRRDFEYLSGFAASPLHLVTFLAPGLFEISPLWRSLVWDPFHTSPEEFLGYIGLPPLFLSIIAVAGYWRTVPAVRALSAVAAITLLLVLGPYVPGFHWLCLLPGFSFFRAPARWTLPLSLALSLLSGIGFDRVHLLKSPRSSLLKFCGGTVLMIALVVGLVEQALDSWEGSGSTIGRTINTWLLDQLPWREQGVFQKLGAEARRPNVDLRVYESWARQGLDLSKVARPIFTERRGAIYQQELARTGAVLVSMIALAILLGNRLKRIFSNTLLIVTIFDLSLVGYLARLDHEPIRFLADESKILASLPEGGRTIDTLRNLPMVAGANPVLAYRTLDLPALEPLNFLASRLPANESELSTIAAAIRATGSRIRIFDPFEVMELDRRKIQIPGDTEMFDAATLAGWRFGVDYVRQQGKKMSQFKIWRLPRSGIRAWLVPLSPGRQEAILGQWSGNPAEVISALSDARPIAVEHESPELRVFRIHSEVPALLVFSELADPQWRAVWTGLNGEQYGMIHRAFGRPNQGAWEAVHVPGNGDWTLRLIYRGVDVEVGLAISLIAWLTLGMMFFSFERASQLKTEA